MYRRLRRRLRPHFRLRVVNVRRRPEVGKSEWERTARRKQKELCRAAASRRSGTALSAARAARAARRGLGRRTGTRSWAPLPPPVHRPCPIRICTFRPTSACCHKRIPHHPTSSPSISIFHFRSSLFTLQSSPFFFPPTNSSYPRRSSDDSLPGRPFRLPHHPPLPPLPACPPSPDLNHISLLRSPLF
jgi:hypothetical protein